MTTKILPIIAGLCFAQTLPAQQDSTLNTIVVTGTRNSIEARELPNTITIIDREQLTENHNPDILYTVNRAVPGLFITSRGMLGYGVSGGGSGGINLRGISGGAGQLLVLIDGHPQYQGIYGHPISDSYQTMMAERVEVLRGPASVLYGSNAMGGVLNIITRAAARKDGVTTNLNLGAGSYGTIQAEGSNQVRHGKFTSTVAAQYNRSDNHRPRMGFEQYGGYLKLGYDISAHWRSYIDADVTRFNASHPGTTTEPLYDADQWITRGVASGVVENHYNRTSGALSVYANWGRHKIDDGTNDPATPTLRYFRSKDNLTGLSAYQSFQLFTGNRLTLGLDYQHIYGNAYYTSKSTGEVLETANKQSGKSHRNEIAAYADFRQDIASWLAADAGLRIDHHSITGTEVIPQVGLVFHPISKGDVKAMVSKGFRNPTMREMYLYPPSTEDLKPERLWNYELAWHHQAGPVTYGANLYYIKGDNVIQTQMVNGQPRNVNTGKIENYGAELEADWCINKHWSLATNHSWLHMKYKMVAAPAYKGFVDARFRYGRWSGNAGLQYISHLYTAVGTGEQTENFCLLNATVGYQPCKIVKLWLRGENLLAQRYEINLGYPMPKATVMGGVSLTL